MRHGRAVATRTAAVIIRPTRQNDRSIPKRRRINYQQFNSDKINKSQNLVLESKLSDGTKYNEEINNLKVFGLNNVSFSKYVEAINLSMP